MPSTTARCESPPKIETPTNHDTNAAQCGWCSAPSAARSPRSAKMQTAIARLSEDQREVFLMREMLDMPLGTVKGRMRLGLEKVRAELAEGMA